MRLFHLFFCLIYCSPLCLSAQTPGQDYKLYDTRKQREITIDEIAADVVPGQVLIFGEQHDDSLGHLLEYNILAALYRKHNNRVLLSMEMFHRDVQYILDEYLAGLISEKNFIKEARAWDTYKADYKPAVEFAKEKGLKVIAANAPSRYTNLVTRKGLEALNGLSKEVKKNYIAPLPVDTMTGLYYDKFLEAMGGHSTPGMHLFQSQNFWDATMAWSIASALKKDHNALIFMMNGRFHSDYHLGFGKRLTGQYGKKVNTISCFSAPDISHPDWAAYKDLADYVIITKGKAEEE